MDPLFLEAATHVNNKAIEEWVGQGKKVIGYVCSHVPEEIITAAGMFSYRLRGIETTSTTIGDTYFGPFICSCPKALLQNAGRGRFNFISGAIMVQACDSMRRLDECWRKAGEDLGNIVPDFWHYFGVPHKVTDYSLKWFTEEIENLARAIEKHYGTTITDEALFKAIDLYNETRDLELELDKLRLSPDTAVSGTEAMTLLLAGTAIPKEVYNPLLKKAINGIKRRKSKFKDKKRILLAGSVVDDLALIELIENEGAVVVSDTVCFGARAYSGQVEKDKSPYRTLAERYLHELMCPRMFGFSNERFDHLKQKMQEAEIDGVIFQNIRFCDLHGSENGLFEGRLEKEGIPSIRVEREYGALADEGRVRMRVGAFLETIPGRIAA